MFSSIIYSYGGASMITDEIVQALQIEDIRYKKCIKKFIKDGGMSTKEEKVLQIKVEGKWQDIREEHG